MSGYYQGSLLLQTHPHRTVFQPTRSLYPPKPQAISRDILPQQHHININYYNDDELPSLSGVSSYGVPLYTYQQIPPYLKGNPHIVGGYRAHIPLGLCMKR